ncbi:hypothetical protein L1987_70670 [Smallanthus sonchifolius]|uniref:Uncharacterized protein n=1 Tax=Smallanthus sonchifolius TaxID=185202 RepID=A0ACB9ARM6_9ASTR|nr:hypothetical protein L1987_70670 [Smallanthus sonchifolius]
MITEEKRRRRPAGIRENPNNHFLDFQVAQAFRPLIQGTVLWKFTRLFAQAYDYGMGVILFTPIACLAWLPIISAFQTRFLFNRAFSRRLQIQPILKAKKKHI